MPDPTGSIVEDLGPTFTDGRLGMIADDSFLVAAIDKENPALEYGVAPMPVSGPGVTPVTWGVTDTLVIGRNADPAVAKAFIDWIYDADRRTEFDVKEGLLPVLRSQVTDPAFSTPVMASFVRMLDNARFDPLHPNYGQLQELLKVAIQEALRGTPAKDALDRAAEDLDALIERGG